MVKDSASWGSRGRKFRGRLRCIWTERYECWGGGREQYGHGGWFESKEGEGVRGTSNNANHGGVVGISTHSGGIGVFGFCDDGSSSLQGTGVFGKSSGGEGVHGETNAGNFTAGVSGLATNGNGVAPGVLGQSIGFGPGVVGKSIADAGVIGFRGDPALQETTVSSDGGKAGVFGASEIGSGVVGYARNPAVPAIFAFGGFRSLALGRPLAGWFQGNVQVDGDIFLPGADCAEQFEVVEPELAEPGTVLVIDDAGSLRRSQMAYDRKVAGVVSGAGDFRPGIVLDKHQCQESRRPVALVGKVFCKVDAAYGAVAVGDLLTTSTTPGHAMRAGDPMRAFGAVVGKALGNLRTGQGLVPILVCLQ